MPISRKPVALLAGMAAAIGALATPVAFSGAAFASEPLPAVFPTPTSIVAATTNVPLNGPVTIVAAANADAPTLRVLQEVVRAAGGTPTVAQALPTTGAAILVSDGAASADVTAALTAANVAGPSDLKAEGYVLTTLSHNNVPTVVLAGKDADGAFYGAQTLRQLVVNGSVAAATVRDNPLMTIRGTIEGFYGIPWSHQARLDLIEFSGKNKMNTFIYSPKDDQLARHQWKTPYPQDELDRMGELIERANANHVDFTYVISPGNTICYSKQADYDAVIAKFDQIRSKGGHSFYVALDDIHPRLNCAEDRAKYGHISNWGFLAVAQAEFLNKIQTEYIEPNNLDDLQTVPTNYNGSGEDPYKRQFGEALNNKVRVQWTGEGVFSDQITDESVQRAARSYRTDHLYIWDNFPVNDGQRNRLFLNPLDGRSPNLHQYLEGFTANPMIQPYASLISLAGYADYTWNPPAYKPWDTFNRILDEIAGPNAKVRSALEVFTDLNQSWRPYRPTSPQAPKFSADVEKYRAGNKADLLARLAVMSELPTTLEGMASKGFYADAKGWIDAASLWGQSLGNLIYSNDAVTAGTGEQVAAGIRNWALYSEELKKPTVPDMGEDSVLRPNSIVPIVGDTRFEAFQAELFGPLNTWFGATPMTGAAPYAATPSTNLGQYSNFSAQQATDGNPDTLYWSNTAGNAGKYFQVDLGSTKSVGLIKIQQGDNDAATGGDMIHHGVVEVSANGSQWQSVGTITRQGLATIQLETAVDARYVRLRAEQNNPGGQWVKIREFQVSAKSDAIATSFTGGTGSVLNVADAKLESSYFVGLQPGAGTITRKVEAGTAPTFADMVGLGSGKIEAEVGGQWTEIGRMDKDQSLHEAAIPAGATAVRLSFDGTHPVMVQEFALRTGNALDETPAPEPTPTTTPAPEPTPTVTPTTTPAPEPTPTTTPVPLPTLTPGPTPTLQVTRLSGADRIATALNIAGSKAETVVLANAFALADGLVATPLATALDAPLLLTGADLDKRVESWISQSGAKKVVLIGQTNSISAKTEKKLKDMGLTVERIGGVNRYETAVRTADGFKAAGGRQVTTAFVVKGDAMPDALAAGPVAAHEEAPVLLVDSTPAGQAGLIYLAQNNVKAVAVGGGAVKVLKGAGVTPTVEAAGVDRFDTAAKLAKRYCPDPNAIGVANGFKLIDALAGGVDVAKRGGVIVFVDTNRVPAPTKNYVESTQAKDLVIYGGAKSVSNSTVEALRKLLK
ncbi:MAG: beta-N-acetylglucosaminidase domain-containing protein [Buchananella hordeovulneris]|nr:beta-N-acetylglucosaminidase domain-containing protein [Buchananella hordeovulneris]